MKKLSCVFIICFLAAIPVFLQAQTAAEIEKLLDTQAISYEMAAGFVLKAAEVTDPSGRLSPDDPAGAFRYAAEKGWLPGKAVAGSEASLGGVSLLLMQSFDLKGGFLYSLFRNPHYAYREIVYQDIMQGRADPDMTVSGDLLLFLVNRILSRLEEEAVLNAAKEEKRRLIAEAEQIKKDQEEVRLAREAAERMEREQAAAAARRAAEQEALAAHINTELSAQAMEDTSARITEQGITISLSNIQFLANSAELPEGEKRKLQEIGRILQTVPGRRILVTGHTALAGTPEDRLKTSQERAAAVAAYLVSLGARRADEVFAQGYGSERPVADNETPEGMALNRRVEITLLEDQ